jgi:adenylate cyclase
MKIFTSSLMVVILATILFAGRFFDLSPIETLRLKTFDYYQKANPRTETTNSVVIVKITEQDLKKYGQWPWPRDLIAELHTKIYQKGAKVIQYNVLFSEADRLNELAKYKDGITNDEKFSKVIAGTNTVMMYSVKYEPTTGPVSKVGVIKLGKPDKFIYNFPGIVTTLPEFLKHARGAGVNIMIPSIDGTVRQIPLFINSDVGTVPNQVLETFRVLVNGNKYKITAIDKGIQSVHLSKNYKILTDKNSMFNINFAKSNSINTYSATELLTTDIDLLDKIVIVGLDASGLSYLKDTPLGVMTDAQITAQAIETAFTKTQLIRNGNTNLIELVGVLAMGILLMLTIPRLGVTSTVGVYLTLLTAIIFVSLTLYNNHNYLLDVSFATVFITIIWGHLTFNNFATQFRLRQQIKKQFEHYLDPRMVKKLQKDPGLLKLGGETRNMTFMFCDIRGFTPISEQYKSNPAGLTKLINRFLTRMTNVIIANSGTVDKFMGDCIMAFWNAPLDTEDHQMLAVLTASQMQRELAILNKQLTAENLPNIKVGIGINTGEALVGNMGSDQRFDYSVIGDPVNLAARLESASKTLGHTLIIGENTKKCIDDKFPFKFVDSITVKGKTEPVNVYTLAR